MYFIEFEISVAPWQSLFLSLYLLRVFVFWTRVSLNAFTDLSLPDNLSQQHIFRHVYKLQHFLEAGQRLTGLFKKINYGPLYALRAYIIVLITYLAACDHMFVSKRA